MQTVLLFDIDGTLIDTGGAGKRALIRAFTRLHGSAETLDFCLAGMTDPAIVRRALRRGAHASGDEAVQAVLAQYLRFLRDEVDNTPPALDLLVQSCSYGLTQSGGSDVSGVPRGMSCPCTVRAHRGNAGFGQQERFDAPRVHPLPRGVSHESAG